MQSVPSFYPNNMTIFGNSESRSRLAQEWEEICQQLKPNSPLAQRQGHGDVNTWIVELNSPDTRLSAMQNLSKFRASVPDMGPLLWFSFGAISSLIQEVMLAYENGQPGPSETARVADALDLLECVAEHPKTRLNFVCCALHEIVAPLARQTATTPHFEVLRRRSLQVIYALLKLDNADRGILSGKEHACILVQLLADDFLASILRNSTQHGQLPSLVLVIQLLDKLFANDDVLTVFLYSADNLRSVIRVLHHLNSVCRTKAPSFCALLNMMNNKLNKFIKHILANQQTKAAAGSLVQPPQFQNEVKPRHGPGAFSYAA